MSYEVRCECGKEHAVSAADAGSSVRCACGRDVNVPPLHQLRAAAGEHGVSPVVQLQAMLLRNELPGTRTCACCDRETDHLIRVSVVCERVITKSPRGSTGVALLGCFALGLPGLLAGLMAKNAMPSEQHGTDVSFVLPVRACEACARALTAPAALRTALDATPAYAAIFDQYPNALIRRLS